MPDRYVVGDGLPGASAEGAAGVFCSHCNTDLADLPLGARYCRHCGVRLRSALAPTAPRPAQGSPGGYRLPAEGHFNWRFWWWGGAPRVQQSAPGDRSFMLLAYAKSMFGLGWRYEHAVGSRRNLSEAVRCYGKAAKLGDADAAARLGYHPPRGDDLSQPKPGAPPPLAQVWPGPDASHS
jgi:TPR repeat protein